MAPPLRAALAGLLLAAAPAFGEGGPPAPAPATEPPGPAAAAPEPPPAAPSPAPPVQVTADPLDGPRRALALGWHGATFWSQAASQYTFHSLSLGYLGSTGRSGSFVHASLDLPLQARQDGRVVNVSTYYDTAFGLDLLLGWQWRRALGAGGELEAGPGLHADLMLLLGKDGYADFSALQLGVGGQVKGSWPTSWHLGASRLRLGAVGSLAVDLWDPVRDGDLRNGFTLRAALVAALDRE